MGGPSTIAQLKELIRLHFPDMVFVCETKQTRGFMSAVCKKLKFGNRWDVWNPIGRKGGLLLAWKDTISIKRIWSTDYCIEVQVEFEDSKDNFVAIFVHASTESKERQLQWEELKDRKHLWGDK